MPTGVKYDEGKAPLFQGCIDYFARALKAVANISHYGKEKYANEYADKGWESVPDGYMRYTDGDARHLADEAIDGLYDPESGYLHAAHHAWNALARLELLLKDGTSLRMPTKVDAGNTGPITPGDWVIFDSRTSSVQFSKCMDPGDFGKDLPEPENDDALDSAKYAQTYANEISKRLSK